MGASTPPTNSINFVRNEGLIGRLQYLTTLNKMGLPRGSTRPYLKTLGKCCMANLPLEFKVEACNTTFYVQNMSPHRVLEDKTLEEEFTGVRPEIWI
jgi:hypothetical protein